MKLFAGLVVVSSATECDPCWQLQADGECHPDPAHITTTCDSSSITVNVDECVFGNRYVASDVYVGDDASNTACQLSANGGLTYLTHGLTECGMTVSYDDANGTLNFVSRMTVPGLQDPTSQIVTTQSLDWSFTCQYDASYEIQEEEMTMNNAPKSSGFTSTGQFNLALNTYNSTGFDHLLDVGNEQLQIGQQVNFGITFNNRQPIDGLTFAPITCRVINSATAENSQPEIFTIWDATSGDLAEHGQCAAENNPVGFDILINGQSFVGMTYSGFGFNSVEGDSQNQQIQCEIEICLDNLENSACNSGCFNWDTSDLEPVFDEWTAWSSCSETCGAGERRRTRECTASCENIELISDHSLLDVESCDAGACPVLCAESTTQSEIESRILTPGPSSTLGLCQKHSSSPHQGILMVKKNGIWGSVCDDYWTTTNAQAACKSLGYTGGTYQTTKQHTIWTEEVVPILMDDVECMPNQNFETCRINPNENCGHGENILLTCNGVCGEATSQRSVASRISTPGSSSTLGLCQTDSNNPRKGILMVQKNGVWGSVCDDEFTELNARAACHSLGYSYVSFSTKIDQSSRWSKPDIPFLMNEVACENEFDSFEDCRSYDASYCIHQENVEVTCGAVP